MHKIPSIKRYSQSHAPPSFEHMLTEDMNCHTWLPAEVPWLVFSGREKSTDDCMSFLGSIDGQFVSGSETPSP